MFCPDPQGESCCTYVALESKMGYISCNDCKEKMSEAVKFWNTHRAYGAANYLKDRDIKIKRSNGDIEPGWQLNNPFLETASDGEITIHCYNKSKNIAKWVLLDSILELNPE
jgi:hypothetical protein